MHDNKLPLVVVLGGSIDFSVVECFVNETLLFDCHRLLIVRICWNNMLLGKSLCIYTIIIIILKKHCRCNQESIIEKRV